MKALLLLFASAALAATGAVVGYHLAGTHDDVAPVVSLAPSEPEVLVRTAQGETRALTTAEAAEKIEALERSLARRRARDAEAPEGDDAAPPPAPPPDPPAKPMIHGDGSPYTMEEVVAAATTSPDAALRRTAIEFLRRADSDEARAALQTVLADPVAPAALRDAAAKALATPPNRDKLPEELIAALRTETDPAVRRTLANGVGRLRDREAWMTDIVALVHGEKDAEARKVLFEAVVRDARDPVARAELLSVAIDKGASLEERRQALAALPRGRTDAETVAKLQDLLADGDARVRENAVSLVASAQALSPSGLAAAFADDDPGVRRAAFNAGTQRLSAFGADKTLPKDEVQRLVDTAVRLASGDPDPSVRRAAMQQVGSLPKAVRDDVLAAGRNDADLYVKLTAYARSPDPVAKQATDLFVSALDAKDAGIRDFAYRQLQRVSGVTAPYDSRWNPKARAAAIEAIRRDLAAPAK